MGLNARDTAAAKRLEGKVIRDGGREKYRIARLIGEGSMGMVFEAMDISLNRACAVKLVRPSLANDEDLLARFRREIYALSRVRSLGVVSILGKGDYFFEGKKIPYFAMELLDGEELAAAIHREAPFSISRAVALTQQILASLGVMHGEAIIHRDLKPENLFLCHSGHGETIKFIDFGLARPQEAEGSSALTATGTMLGTPDYMAPEQANPEQLVDERADFFAVGTVLFEMLTHQLPFNSGSITASLAAKVGGVGAIKLRAFRNPQDEDENRILEILEAAIAKSLALMPGDRYQTAAEFQSALQLVGSVLRGEVHARGRAESQRLDLSSIPDLAASVPVTLAPPEKGGGTAATLLPVSRSMGVEPPAPEIQIGPPSVIRRFTMEIIAGVRIKRPIAVVGLVGVVLLTLGILLSSRPSPMSRRPAITGSPVHAATMVPLTHAPVRSFVASRPLLAGVDAGAVGDSGLQPSPHRVARVPLPGDHDAGHHHPRHRVTPPPAATFDPTTSLMR